MIVAASVLALATLMPAPALAKDDPSIFRAKSTSKMFDGSLVIAKQTYTTQCYPDYDYEAEPYECEKPCAATHYNVYGYTNEKGKPTVDVSAYFSDYCDEDYSSYSADAKIKIGKGDNTWDQKDTQIDFKGAATLKGDKFGYAYDKDGNEIPGPKNELRGVDVEIKLKYGCKELEIYDNQCTTFEKNPKMVVFSKNFYYTQTCRKQSVNYIKINGKKFKWDDSSFGISKSKDVSFTTDRSVP